jgi:hypothetical protein
MKYSLGLQPTRPELVEHKLADFYDHHAAIPTIPANYGHTNLISRWGMLGNGPDSVSTDIPVGDCAICGPEHLIMGWNAAALKSVPPFTYSSTIDMYTAITQYDPSQYDPTTQTNPTDQGSDMTAVAKYWQTTGFKDAAGDVHQIVAFLGLDPKDTKQITAATYLFEGVGFGFDLPASAEQQFEAGQPWTVTGADIVGGHYVPVLGKLNGNYLGVTWGGIVTITPEFIAEYGSLALAYLGKDMFNLQGKSAEGLDLGALTATFPALEAL